MSYATIPEALEALKAGQIILVTDNEDRENEGDFICAAEFATTENVNFMASIGKGLICMPMTSDLASQLGLSPMVAHNTDPHETAFTESIDHIDTGTGISAIERGLTARKAVEAGAKPHHFKRPGHMFPLVAKKGGVLERQGHTEATVDLMRLADLSPCGLCCEIMADDGSMMRTPDLLKLAAQYNMPMITIEALIAYRKSQDRLIRRVAIADLPSKFGTFQVYAYDNSFDGLQHLAIVKGLPQTGDPFLCRVHSECLTGDVLGSLRCDCGNQLQTALQAIEEKGQGAVIYLRQEGRGIGLNNKIKAYALQDQGMDTVEANHALGFPDDLRDYTIAGQILKDLGATTIDLMTNNPDKISALENLGITIAHRTPIISPTCPHNRDYIHTKVKKMDHLIPISKEEKYAHC